MAIRRVAPLSQSMLDELYDKNTTVARSNAIHKKIDARFEYVFHKAMEIMKWGVDWFAFANHQGDGDFGRFMAAKYKTKIAYDGEFFARETDDADENAFLYDFQARYSTIPTRWLSEDFEEALKAEFEAAKTKALKQSKAETDGNAKSQNSIKAKPKKA